MKFVNVNNLNAQMERNPIDFVSQCEREYVDQLTHVAEYVSESRVEKPVVLISGPSGSGKTSSALKLAKILLEEYDCPCSTISLDNYFKSNSSPDMPRNPDGSIDLESPLCTDIDLLKEHIHSIMQGKSFDMPHFDFATQSRKGFRPFTVNRGDVVIFEGIHALNPLVTGSFDTTKVYVSVRTRLVNDDGSVLHPRRIRLMRRLVRDSKFRGRRYGDVFNYFDSVSVGEDRHIMPFKPLAQFDIDTFHGYEASVYRNYLLDGLVSIQSEMQSNVDYTEIVSFLSELNPLDPKLVPKISMVREFIGGSRFKY